MVIEHDLAAHHATVLMKRLDQWPGSRDIRIMLQIEFAINQ